MLVNIGTNRGVLFIRRTTIFIPSPTGIMLTGVKLTGVKVNIPYIEIDFSNQSLSTIDVDTILAATLATYPDIELTWRVINVVGNNPITDAYTYDELIANGWIIYGDTDFYYRSVEMVMQNEGDVRFYFDIDPGEVSTQIGVGALIIEDDQDYTQNYPDKSEKKTFIATKSPGNVNYLQNISNFLTLTSGGLRSIRFRDITNYDSLANINLKQNYGLHSVVFDSTPVNKIGELNLQETNIGRPYDDPDHEVTDFYQPAFDPLLSHADQDWDNFFIEGWDWVLKDVTSFRAYQDGFATYNIANKWQRTIPIAELKQWLYFSYTFGQSGFPYGFSYVYIYQNGIEIYNNNQMAFNPDYGSDKGGNNGSSAFEFEITDFGYDLVLEIHTKEFQLIRTNQSSISYKLSDTQLPFGDVDLSAFTNGINKLHLGNNPWKKNIIFPNTTEAMEVWLNIPVYFSRGFQDNIINLNVTVPIKGIFYGFYRQNRVQTVTFVDTTELVTGLIFYACTNIATFDFSPIKNFEGAAAYLTESITISYASSLTSLTLPPNGVGSLLIESALVLTSIDFVTPNYELKGAFGARNSPLLTSITHVASTNAVTSYRAYSCDLTGTLDLSGILLTGYLQMYININLTSVLFSTQSNYLNAGIFIYMCDLTGTLDLSNVECGTTINLRTNPNLTNVTFKSSTLSVTQLQMYSCDLTGILDISMLSGLSGLVYLYINSNLTNVTFPSNGLVFTNIRINHCNLTGTLNISGINLGTSTYLQLNSNPLLTAITWPTGHNSATDRISTFYLGATALTKINWPTNILDIDGFIHIDGITFTSAEINEFVYDVDQVSNTGYTHQFYWDGAQASLLDATSGGFDGDAAKASLEAKGWTFI